MTLLSIFTNSEYDPDNPLYERALKEKEGNNLTKKDIKANKKKVKKARRVVNAVLIYGTFMANMIDAQTSDQVKNILKAATLPPGSSRIKRQVATNFTINSYLGGALAYDQILNGPSDLVSGGFGASLSVPIGFTYSFSPDWIFKKGGSFSLHVPLIDLGAITAFRTDSDNDGYTIDELPEFNWKNLFAPGLFFVWNIKDSPFSLGGGGEFGPQLREITINGGEPVLLNSARFPMFFFSIDVPFFNLHTGAKKVVVD